MRERPEEFVSRYGISARNGFLPDAAPLSRLPDPYYAPWEELIQNLPDLLSTSQLKSKVDCLPVLDVTRLELDAEWQRAYVILGFLTHAYIWGGEQPSEVLPPQITRPFLAIAEHLGLPPTATYGTLNLWNFQAKNAECPLNVPENLQSLHTFTGTKDEEWFYLISVSVEARGSPLILDMLRCLQAVDDNNSATIVSCLRSITAGIKELTQLLGRMHEHCDPQVFYHNIRPLLAGSKGMAAAGLSKGILYDEGKGRSQWRQYSGGSNAQSSLIQLFDIFLAVDHHASGGFESRNVGSSRSTPSKTNAFIQEMRKYMPRPHREFLSQVSKMSDLRDYIARQTEIDSTAVREAYNEAVAALVGFRDTHIQIVARYIIMPSRSAPAPRIVQKGRLNIATASSELTGTCLAPSSKAASRDSGDKQGLRGTGGTDLIPFLKTTRNETRDAALSADDSPLGGSAV